MAKGPKSNSSGINMVMLAAIVNAAAAGQQYFVGKNEHSVALVTHNPPLIEVDTATPNPANGDEVAARPTEAGKVMVANAVAAANGSQASAAPEGAEASQFSIIKGVELPKSKKRGGGGGAPVKYPFDTMEVKDSFFVPKTEKMADPAKSLGGTVSSANLRYAKKTGEVEKQVTKRGPKNRAVIGADGKPVKEAKMMPVWEYTRRFSIRPVVGGMEYGGWKAPADGAVISRTA